MTKDIPPFEGARGVGYDSLWMDDPEARVVYSGRPTFFDGSGVAPMTHGAEEFLLARTDIAEALEQIYLHQTSLPGAKIKPEAEASDRVAPIDAQLAMEGLDALRKSVERSSNMLVYAEVAQAELISQTGIESKAYQADLEKARLQREADERAREEQSERRKAQMDAVIQQLEESHTELEFEGFVKLVGTLAASETPEGVQVLEYKGFSLTINDQVDAFFKEPSKLVNGMGAMKAAAAFFSEQTNRDTYPLVAAFTDKIEHALTGTVNHGEAYYEDLPASRIDQWLSAIDSAPDQEGAADILLATGALPRTLRRMAHEDPARFIDRLHTLAMRGIDPDDYTITHAATREIIEDTLQGDAMAATSLVRGAYIHPNFSQRSGTRHQALDLMLALEEYGYAVSDYWSPETEQELPDQDTAALADSFGHVGRAQESDLAAEEIASFRRAARTRRRRDTTLLGRKLAAPEAGDILA